MLSSPRKAIRISLVVLFLAVSLGLTQCQAKSDQPPSGKGQSTPAAPLAGVSTPDLSWSTAIAKVAKESIPAVVHIEVTQSQEVNNPLMPFENNPFFHFFFNTPRDMPRKFKRELKGLGTGMILDAEGNILTNNHVVGGASKIQVLLADGAQYDATTVGTDPKTDLAVIRIKTNEKLPHITFGDSDTMEVGDWVVAIGHPRGLDQTVTQGIISAKHRRGILDPTSYQDYLQTDAAINPGNSGGPLLNLEGKVIGVNSAIVSESGGFEGIGFAIPSNIASYISKALITNGKVQRGWLGVSIKDLTPALAQTMKLEVEKGALVQDVVKGSPADEAGFKKQDVVTEYAGHPITDASTLQNQVANTPIGQEVALTVMREGKAIPMKVKIGDLQEAVKKMAQSAEDRLGATLRPVTAKEAQQFGMQEDTGVAIESLQKESPLAEAGFEVNDIITAINNIAVNGVEGFIDIVKTLPAKQSVVLTAIDHRSGQTGYVQVEAR
jgi:serine protease Do